MSPSRRQGLKMKTDKFITIIALFGSSGLICLEFMVPCLIKRIHHVTIKAPKLKIANQTVASEGTLFVFL